MTVGAGLTLAGTFLTWVRSGATDRSSYEVFGLVDRLGFSPDGAIGWALRLWPLLPLMLVAIVIAHWWDVAHPAWSTGRASLATGALAYSGGIAIAVGNAPEIGLFEVGPGPAVTLAGAAVMLVGLVLQWGLDPVTPPG